jgi:hypothetical protein
MGRDGTGGNKTGFVLGSTTNDGRHPQVSNKLVKGVAEAIEHCSTTEMHASEGICRTIEMVR